MAPSPLRPSPLSRCPHSRRFLDRAARGSAPARTFRPLGPRQRPRRRRVQREQAPARRRRCAKARHRHVSPLDSRGRPPRRPRPRHGRSRRVCVTCLRQRRQNRLRSKWRRRRRRRYPRRLYDPRPTPQPPRHTVRRRHHNTPWRCLRTASCGWDMSVRHHRVRQDRLPAILGNGTNC